MTKLIAYFPVESRVCSYSSPFSRVVGALPFALIVTLVLFYTMHILIHNDQPFDIKTDTGKIPPVVMNTPTEITVQNEMLPVKPVIREMPPRVVAVDPIEVDFKLPGDGLGGPVITEKGKITNAFETAGQMVPFIKVPPQYPQTALAKGVEGYVDVMFDVTELGTTDNIRIIGYEPSSVFNRSVLKAIKNWKYKPNVVDGVPVRSRDVRDRIRFNLDK